MWKVRDGQKRETFSGDRDVLYLDYSVGYTGYTTVGYTVVYVFKTHQTVYLRSQHCMKRSPTSIKI